jgi:iron(III) transport system substrate-binding protein
MQRIRALVAIIILIATVLGLWAETWRRDDARVVVVYCAHDAVYADGVLKDFTKATGIAVSVRYDTEATKSLGLVERLIAEAPAPQCDVFWNNEQLGTMDLARRGILAPYRGSGWSRIPARFRADDGTWTGFAARMRVVIENTAIPGAASHVPAQGAIAKPLYGTTLTHYCALWQRFGGDAVKRWHAALHAHGIHEVDGNALVRAAVADGVSLWGLTDTDDAYEALDGGKPVRMVPARVTLIGADPDAPGATAAATATAAMDDPVVLIPNTVAVVNGAPHLTAAQQLADYLACAGTEIALAKSGSRQVPLGPVDAASLPPDVQGLLPYVAQAMPIDARLLAARDEVLPWLKAEYAGQ